MSNKFINVTMWEHRTFDRFLDVAKFTTLAPLSLLILWKLPLPIVGLRVYSLPTLALKSPKEFSYFISGIYRIYGLISGRS
jgi:hypothetical protein